MKTNRKEAELKKHGYTYNSKLNAYFVKNGTIRVYVDKSNNSIYIDDFYFNTPELISAYRDFKNSSSKLNYFSAFRPIKNANKTKDIRWIDIDRIEHEIFNNSSREHLDLFKQIKQKYNSILFDKIDFNKSLQEIKWLLNK